MQSNLTPGRRSDVLLLIFTIIGIVALAGWGIFRAIVGFTTNGIASPTSLASSLMDAFGLFLCAGLLVPLLLLCIRKLQGREIPPVKLPPAKIWPVAGLLGVWLLLLVIGSILNGLSGNGAVIALPFLSLGIVIPVAALAWIAISGLPVGTWRRLWAAFSIGMTGSTLLAMILEYSLVGIAVLAASIVAIANPEWQTIFQQIKNQVVNAGDIQTLLTTLAPYINNPLVLVLALAFAAVLAPVIEETLKPAAVWLLGKRLQSPAEGFALGALCGAGFAMLEGTLAASGSLQMLGVGLAARAASSLMHITASGVMGWGIASAWLEKRYGRLAGAYLISVSMHGLWNGSVVLAVFGGLRLTVQASGTDLLGMLLVVIGILILGSMLVTIMILLPVINHRLRAASRVDNTPVQSDIIGPPLP